jgi:DNA polymerase elongation subunit (family B)
LRLLIIDIETSPNLAHVWGMWQQNVGKNQLLEPTHMMCFAAKFVGEEKVHFYSEYHHGREKMVRAAHKLLSEADAVIHYNGKRFDIPHLHREFLLLGLFPPAPFKQIDLLEVVKRQFEFPFNALAYVSKALGLPGKVDTGGHELWIACLNNSKKAWNQMKAYNIQDVVLLEPMYLMLLPWIPSHPSWGAYEGEDVCPNCGSSQLVREGYAYTAMGQFQRFHCADCKRWSRSNKRVGGTKVANIPASG